MTVGRVKCYFSLTAVEEPKVISKVFPNITVGFICNCFWCFALGMHCNKNTLEDISIEMNKLKFEINRFSFNLNKTKIIRDLREEISCTTAYNMIIT